MSSKPESAQQPAAQVDTGTAPPPIPLQPHHAPNYHQGQVIYQQPYPPVTHYQHQGQPVWNQAPQTTVHYMQYAPQPENPNYQENKVQGYNHYGTVHFAQPMDNGDMMMRGQQQFVPQQYMATAPQWYPTSQPPPPQGHFVPSYATSFNVANDPTYHPNHPLNRQGPGRRDDFQGAGDNPSVGYMQFMPFVAPIGMMESQAHASASYTANWVSSTSSIPPEMKDEPESDNISQYDSQRPMSQQNGDSWTDREQHFSPSSISERPMNPPQPQSSSRQSQQGEREKAPSQKSTKTQKSEKSEDKRELTFDERLEKARMQKSRVENEAPNNGATSPNASTAPAPTVAASSAASSAPPAPAVSNYVPRANGQRKEYNHGVQNMNNNMNQNNGGRYQQQNQYHNNGNHGSVPGGNHNQNQNQNHQYQVPRANIGNATGERDRQPRRDNNYSNNRFDNNQQNQNPQLHQQHQQQFPQQHQNQNQNQNQFPHQNQNQDYQRPPNNRGGRGGGRGGYRGGYNQPYQQNNQPAPYMQMMNPHLFATINAFKNTHIGNLPQNVARMPLLPGPFGLTRQPPVQQNHGPWLDANGVPMPLAAMMNMDPRFARGPAVMGGPPMSYRGRGRGGYGYRGGYRGGGYGNNNGRYVAKNTEAASASAATPKVENAEVAENADPETKDEEKKDEVKNDKESVENDDKKSEEVAE